MSSLGIIQNSPRATRPPSRPPCSASRPSPRPSPRSFEGASAVVIVAPVERARPTALGRCVSAACDRDAALLFAGNLWKALILAWTLTFFAQLDGSEPWLPFATMTYTSTMLSFLTRSELVRNPDLVAASGIVGLALFVAYWTTLLVAGRGGISAMAAGFPVYRDVTLYTFVPLDAFFVANVRGLYASYLGAWYTLAIMLGYIAYFYSGPVPYPVIEALDDGPRAGAVVGASLGVPLLHVLYVAAARLLRCRAASGLRV